MTSNTVKAITLAACLSGLSTAYANCEPLQQRVDALLKAYSEKNLPELTAMLDDSVLVMGSDVSEVADTKAKVSKLASDDFALWTNASFGQPLFLNCRQTAQLSTAAFDVPISMARPDGTVFKTTVRFLTVWNHVPGHGWLLTQSINSTPTTGQSAADLVRLSKGAATSR
jgi:hypothetical protein